ncbi:MAG: ABC transporter substrate-binding protein [Kastovskya adunca ATA6-11-RM4]|jgi:NitT/TauT family transport system substrate-binding protein|nr:ABC transporter substrate-binding protein [Kastovskya adunca ATA6-11-RM4]
MKINKLISLLTLFVFSLAIAASCTPSSPTAISGNSASENATIQMGFSVWPGWLPWQVAQEQNLFEENNVKVDLKWFDGYLDSINAFTAGQLDANSQTLNDALTAAAAGVDLAVVLVNDNSTGNDKIIARDGINSVSDLKGKTIAVEEGTVDHFLLLLGMKEAGLSAKDVNIQPLETGAAAAAFVAGQVDAVGVFAPFTTQALQRPGSKELFSSKDFPGAIPDLLVVKRQLIEERPQDVQALVNTWFDTLNYLEKNNQKGRETLAKQAGVSVEEYKNYDAGTTIFRIEDNLKAFEPGNDMKSLPYAAKEISEFLLEAGLVREAPDISNIFDDQFVKAYAEKGKT